MLHVLPTQTDVRCASNGETSHAQVAYPDYMGHFLGWPGAKALVGLNGLSDRTATLAVWTVLQIELAFMVLLYIVRLFCVHTAHLHKCLHLLRLLSVKKLCSSFNILIAGTSTAVKQIQVTCRSRRDALVNLACAVLHLGGAGPAAVWAGARHPAASSGGLGTNGHRFQARATRAALAAAAFGRRKRCAASGAGHSSAAVTAQAHVLVFDHCLDVCECEPSPPPPPPPPHTHTHTHTQYNGPWTVYVNFGIPAQTT